MSLLSLSKKILSRDKKTAVKKPETSKTGQKDKPKKEVATASVTAGNIGMHVVMSEKALNAGKRNTFVVKVLPSATKGQIKEAVKEQFGVNALRIRTAKIHPKTRRRGITAGVTKQWKKAYVTVADIEKVSTNV